MTWLVVCGLFFGIGFLYGAFWRAHYRPDAVSAAYDAGYAMAKRLVKMARIHAYGEGYMAGKAGRPATGPTERVYTPGSDE